MSYINIKVLINQVLNALNQVADIFVTTIYPKGNSIVVDFKSLLVERALKDKLTEDQLLHLTRGSLEIKKENDKYIVSAHIPTLKPVIPHPVKYTVLHPQPQWKYVNGQLQPVSYFVGFVKELVTLGDLPYAIFMVLGYKLR